MPFEQRVVQPIACGRGCVPMDQMGQLAIAIPNELECVTNGTLANIIRQLSSLSRFAEDLFAAILDDASVLVVRAAELQARIGRLGDQVTALDSAGEAVSLQDIHLRKPFRSAHNFDQQVVARHSIPANLLAVYRACDRPPPLQKLNAYRDDGKDGLKFYTDPNYFFELWRQEMLKDTERLAMDRTRKAPRPRGHEPKKQRKQVRPPNNSRERFRQMAHNQGEFILEPHARPHSLEVRVSPQLLEREPESRTPPTREATPTRRLPSMAARPSQPPPAPPVAVGSPPAAKSQRESLPPPPPPPEVNGQPPERSEPPPPPPPPPNEWPRAEPERVAAPCGLEREIQALELRKTVRQEKPLDAMGDARSDLLQAIREGIKLKRVEDKRREVERAAPLHDVASILARRVAIELSDSEREDEEDEDDAWDDESEC